MVDGSGTSAGMARNDGALPALPKTRNALLRGPSCALDLTKLALGQPQGAAAAQTPPNPRPNPVAGSLTRPGQPRAGAWPWIRTKKYPQPLVSGRGGVNNPYRTVPAPSGIRNCANKIKCSQPSCLAKHTGKKMIRVGSA